MVIHQVASTRYNKPGRLSFAVATADIPAEARRVVVRLTREAWAAGACADITIRATDASGLVKVSGPTRIDGGALQFRGSALLASSKTWDWSTWATGDHDAQGKPVFQPRGTEATKSTKPVFNTVADDGSLVEQPITLHQPTSIDVTIDVLQTLRTAITVEIL